MNKCEQIDVQIDRTDGMQPSYITSLYSYAWLSRYKRYEFV